MRIKVKKKKKAKMKKTNITQTTTKKIHKIFLISSPSITEPTNFSMSPVKL